MGGELVDAASLLSGESSSMYQTPRRSPSPPPALHLPFDVHTDLDVLMRGWLATTPLMEVAPKVEGRFLTEVGRRMHAIKVQEAVAVESPLVAELKPHTLLRVLETHELSDGSMRALVVLHRARRPLGWLTATTAEGEAIIHVYARPIYEVTCAAKVRRQSEVQSRYVGQLQPGTRLHVVETRRVSGGQRVAVRLLGQLTANGWITATKADGSKMLKEVVLDADAVGMHEAQLRPSSPRSPRVAAGAATPRPPPPVGACAAANSPWSQPRTPRVTPRTASPQRRRSAAGGVASAPGSGRSGSRSGSGSGAEGGVGGSASSLLGLLARGTGIGCSSTPTLGGTSACRGGGGSGSSSGRGSRGSSSSGIVSQSCRLSGDSGAKRAVVAPHQDLLGGRPTTPIARSSSPSSEQSGSTSTSSSSREEATSGSRGAACAAAVASAVARAVGSEGQAHSAAGGSALPAHKLTARQWWRRGFERVSESLSSVKGAVKVGRQPSPPLTSCHPPTLPSIQRLLPLPLPSAPSQVERSVDQTIRRRRERYLDPLELDAEAVELMARANAQERKTEKNASLRLADAVVVAINTPPDKV